MAPYGGHDAMIKDLKEKVFQNAAPSMLKFVDGKLVVRSI